jgi:hydrogenase nickel incorporation protein HypA/HybF
MHELSIAQAIIDVADEEVRKAGATRALSVTVLLGELSGVMEDQLRFCFPVVARGTAAEHAELFIETVAGRAWCDRCEKEYHMPALVAPCPVCGGFTHDVRAGQELLVARLEVE